MPTGKGSQKEDEEAPNAVAATKNFPTPQFVVTIYAPVLVTVDRSDDHVESAWKPHLLESSGLSSEAPKKKKIKVKMRSLMLKMVNRLIREEVVPYEAVSVVAGPSFMSVRILVAPSAVSVIMIRCEHIGLGNAVGTVYVCPLETSLVPPAVAGPKKEITISESRASPSVAIKPKEVGTLATEEQTRTTEDDDGDSVSDEDEDGDETKVSVPKSVGIPFISAEQRKKLQEHIIQARQEWRDTASRVRVKQVVEEVSAGAAFTIDYAAFVLCAAFIAAAGLATDSGPTVIASMLVSPIMGPVLGLTFGTTVRKTDLIRTSFRNECLSLLICFVVGAICSIIAVIGNTPETRSWPSSEMTSRGDVYGLVSGVFVAIPSGVAVALSTLGRNSSGMVGVAISLSLLPPAVNASMCWVYELLLKSDTYNRNEGDNTNYWEIGGISFALTVVNIICIWMAGTFTFWLKEVAPIKQKNAFWSHDVAIYRRQNEGTDLEVINEGIEAALELQDAAAEKDDFYKGTEDFDLTEREVAAARRRGLAGNAMEDAFYFDNRGLARGSLVAGGAVSGAIPDEVQLQDAVELTARRASLIENANKFGGLEEAGEALFDNEILGATPSVVGSDEFVYTDVGIQHDAVAEDVLLQGFF